MRTLRLPVVGALLLMLVGVPGGVAPAQAASPAASPAGAFVAAFVTGTEECAIDMGTVTREAHGVEHYRDGTARCEHQTDDPRVTGTTDYTWEADWWEPGGVQWGAGTISNDGGTWEGAYTGVMGDPTGGDVITFWMRGTGDYAGLSYYYRVTGSGPWQVTGYIFEGDPPAPSLQAPANS